MIKQYIHTRSGFRRTAALLTVLFFLSASLGGCSSVKGLKDTAQAYIPVELPEPNENIPSAPLGDITEGEIWRAQIYSVNADGSMLAPSTRVMWLTAPETKALRLCEEALRTPTLSDSTAIAPRNSSIAYIETGMQTATVNVLPGSVLTGSNAPAHLASAMASTLMELDDIENVNVLVSDRAMSYMNLPIGAITQEGASLEKMLADASSESVRLSTADADDWRLTRNVTMYFPSWDGKYIIPQTRETVFTSPDYATQLIDGLSKAPPLDKLLPGIPLVGGALESDCVVVNESDENILEIRFSKTILNALEISPVEKWQFLASIAMTVTTFCPDISGVRIFVNGESVQKVKDNIGTEIVFPGAIIRRSDFAGRIGALVPTYFKDQDGNLLCEMHAVPLMDVASVRQRLSLLMNGPDTYGLFRTFPRGLTQSDVLGTRLKDGVASINLSSEVYRLCQSMTPNEEFLFVYSIVNTLSTIEGVTGVRIYIDSRSVDTLAGHIWLKGLLLPNIGLASD